MPNQDITVKVDAKNKKIIITMPLEDPIRPSASGKNLVLASTRGNVRGLVEFNGKPVSIGVNVYMPVD